MSKQKQLDNEEMLVASATECTGLMPALPQNAQENASSADLYAIHRAKKHTKK